MGSGRRRARTAAQGVLDDERLGRAVASEQLEDEGLGIRVVLAHAPSAEPTDPDGGAPTVPTIHPSLPSGRGQCCHVLSAGGFRAPRWNASRTTWSNPSRSRRNARTGVLAITLAVRGTSRSKRDLAEVRPGTEGPDDRAVLGPRRPDRIGSRRTHPRPPPARPGSRPASAVTHDPCSSRSESSSVPSAENGRHLAELGHRLQRQPERRRVDRVRQAAGRTSPCRPRTARHPRPRERSRSSVRTRAARAPRTSRPSSAS